MNFQVVPMTIACMVAALVATSAGAQDPGLNRAPQSRPIRLVNGVIHPVSGPVIPSGHVAFDAGRITSVGDGAPVDGSADVVDLHGGHVWPGLIGAVTQLGLTEIGSVRSTQDFDETGEATPEVIGGIGVNPDSALLPVTRANGILTVGVFPTGGLVPGRASVIRLEGWTTDDLIVVRDAGLILNWPSMRPRGFGFGRRAETPDAADDAASASNRQVEALDALFRDAEVYAARRAREPEAPVDVRLESMRGVVHAGPGLDKGDRAQVFVHANDRDQIIAAALFASRHGLRIVIVGGQDAPGVAPLLRQRGIPVVVLGTFKAPRRSDAPYDEAFTLPSRLESAGLRWCLASGDETPHERNLPYAAGLAVAFGLKPDAALRSITLSAAQILGVDELLGSLEVGKNATLFVTDGPALEATSHVLRVFVDGRAIDLTNRHTRLAAKYREKYRQLGLLK